MGRDDLGAVSFVMGVPGDMSLGRGHLGDPILGLACPRGPWPCVDVTWGTTPLVMGATSLVMGVAGQRSLEGKPCPQGRVPRAVSLGGVSGRWQQGWQVLTVALAALGRCHGAA